MNHNPQPTSKSARQHILFLIAGLLTAVYLYFRSPTTVTLRVIGIVLAYVAALGGILFIGRRYLSKIFRRLHGLPEPEHPHAGHSHPHGGPETEGATISWAFLYDLLVKMLFAGKEQQFREKVIDRARIQPGEKVLDVGCGTGKMAIIARMRAPSTAEIYGMDASPEMIARAREHAANTNVHVDFQTGLVEAIAFPDNSLDVVLSNFMVHHLPDPLKIKAFAEIYRVLKPGGRLQVVEFEPPTKPLPRFFLGLLLKGMMDINTRAIPPLLEQAGFTSITYEGSGHPLATVVSGKKKA